MINHSLKQLPEDKKSKLLKMGALFPQTPDPSAIPLVDFELGDAEIKDQDANPLHGHLCAEYSASTVGEAEDGIGYSAAYQGLKVQQIENGASNVFVEGTDLITVAKSVQDYGLLPSVQAPSDIDSMDDYHNLPPKVDNLAMVNEKSYISAEGNGDTFDSIRSMMWQNYQKYKSNPNETIKWVLTGMMVRASWESAPGGIVPETYEPNGSGHSFVFRTGQKIINGQPYLIAQWPNGKNMGDNGLFYFPRSVVNKEAIYGNLYFVPIDKKLLIWLQSHNLSSRWLLLAKLVAALGLQSYL